MIPIRNLAAAAALGLAGLLAASPVAEAARIVMCAPSVSGQASPRQIGGLNSAMPSQTLYTLDGRGCAQFSYADVGYLASQGFVQVGGLRAAVLGAFSATPATITLPMGTYIVGMIAEETSGTAIVSGWRVGTTTNAADVVGGGTATWGVPLGASGLSFASDVSLAKRVFSSTVPQQLFWSTVGPQSGSTLINSAVNWTVLYSYF